MTADLRSNGGLRGSLPTEFGLLASLGKWKSSQPDETCVLMLSGCEPFRDPELGRLRIEWYHPVDVAVVDKLG